MPTRRSPIAPALCAVSLAALLGGQPAAGRDGSSGFYDRGAEGWFWYAVEPPEPQPPPEPEPEPAPDASEGPGRAAGVVPMSQVAGCSWNHRPDVDGIGGRIAWNAHPEGAAPGLVLGRARAL